MLPAPLDDARDVLRPEAGQDRAQHRRRGGVDVHRRFDGQRGHERLELRDEARVEALDPRELRDVGDAPIGGAVRRIEREVVLVLGAVRRRHPVVGVEPVHDGVGERCRQPDGVEQALERHQLARVRAAFAGEVVDVELGLLVGDRARELRALGGERRHAARPDFSEMVDRGVVFGENRGRPRRRRARERVGLRALGDVLDLPEPERLVPEDVRGGARRERDHEHRDDDRDPLLPARGRHCFVLAAVGSSRVIRSPETSSSRTSTAAGSATCAVAACTGGQRRCHWPRRSR